MTEAQEQAVIEEVEATIESLVDSLGVSYTEVYELLKREYEKVTT